jgi:ribA/ribD-fused uncharacterized protein
MVTRFYADLPITFSKVTFPNGWLGNMAPFPIRYDGKYYKTTEALFQALRYIDSGLPDIAEQIRREKSPIAAKVIAKKSVNKELLNPQVLDPTNDLIRMEKVLRLKLEFYPQLAKELLATTDNIIIEDCTARPGGSAFFWGAVYKGAFWEGENHLGNLWMKIRNELGCEM